MAIGTSFLQGSGSGSFLQTQPSARQTQSTPSSSLTVQSTGSGMGMQAAPTPGLNQGNQPVLGARTASAFAPGTDTGVAIDPAQAAAQAKAAEDAAKAGRLRGEVTNLINAIKETINARYGQLDAVGAEQAGKLNTRFQNESQELTDQIGKETELTAAGAAAGGTFDSSYRGNNQDTITKAGQGQIRSLGTELEDNLGAVGTKIQETKAGLDADKGGFQAQLDRLGEETDPDRLTLLRNQIDAKLREFQAGNAANVTQAQAVTALNKIAPTNARAQQLQTTLGKIVSGNAPTAQKSAVAQQLISASGISPEEAQRLQAAFVSDLSAADKPQEQL